MSDYGISEDRVLCPECSKDVPSPNLSVMLAHRALWVEGGEVPLNVRIKRRVAWCNPDCFVRWVQVRL